MLSSKNVLYVEMDNGISKYGFASLRELRKAPADTRAIILVNGPRHIAILVDVMLTAVRNYLGRHETSYIKYMDENKQGKSLGNWDLKWPGLYRAALEPVALREVHVGAIASLSAFAKQQEKIDWASKSCMQEYIIDNTSLAETPSFSAVRPVSKELIGVHSTIIDALRSDVLSTRVAAVDELAKRMGPQVVAALIKALDNYKPLYRYRSNPVARRCLEMLRNMMIGREHLQALIHLASKSTGRLTC